MLLSMATVAWSNVRVKTIHARATITKATSPPHVTRTCGVGSCGQLGCDGGSCWCQNDIAGLKGTLEVAQHAGAHALQAQEQTHSESAHHTCHSLMGQNSAQICCATH